MGWSCSGDRPPAPGHPGHQTWQCLISSCRISSRTMFTSHHLQRHYQTCETASLTTCKDTTRLARPHLSPLAKTLPDLRDRINTAIGNVTQDMLERVGREWEYRLDICRVTRGAHIECIQDHYETADIPLSNGSNIIYLCSVFVKIWFCKSSDNLYASCSLFKGLPVVFAHLDCNSALITSNYRSSSRVYPILHDNDWHIFN